MFLVGHNRPKQHAEKITFQMSQKFITITIQSQNYLTYSI